MRLNLQTAIKTILVSYFSCELCKCMHYLCLKQNSWCSCGQTQEFFGMNQKSNCIMLPYMQPNRTTSLLFLVLHHAKPFKAKPVCLMRKGRKATTLCPVGELPINSNRRQSFSYVCHSKTCQPQWQASFSSVGSENCSGQQLGRSEYEILH